MYVVNGFCLWARARTCRVKEAIGSLPEARERTSLAACCAFRWNGEFRFRAKAAWWTAESWQWGSSPRQEFGKIPMDLRMLGPVLGIFVNMKTVADFQA